MIWAVLEIESGDYVYVHECKGTMTLFKDLPQELQVDGYVLVPAN